MIYIRLYKLSKTEMKLTYRNYLPKMTRRNARTYD